MAVGFDLPGVWRCGHCGQAYDAGVLQCVVCGNHAQGAAIYDEVNHPAHYGGVDDPFEVIKVEEAWGIVDNHYLCCVIEYIARHNKKGGLTDLKKARWWLNRYIENMEEIYGKES